jgi:hypothetical protein
MRLNPDLVQVVSSCAAGAPPTAAVAIAFRATEVSAAGPNLILSSGLKVTGRRDLAMQRWPRLPPISNSGLPLTSRLWICSS